MESVVVLRQQIIASLMAEQPDNIAGDAMDLWEKLADEIISIVGEAGFDSLYERSLHLAQPTFPWLPPCPSPPQTHHRRNVKIRISRTLAMVRGIHMKGTST